MRTRAHIKHALSQGQHIVLRDFQHQVDGWVLEVIGVNGGATLLLDSADLYELSKLCTATLELRDLGAKRAV